MFMNNKVLKLIKNFQISLFGVSNLEQYQNALSKFGGDIVKNYKFGISIGISLPNSIVNGLKNRFDLNNSSLYYYHSYQLINDRLNLICSIISSFLNSKGYKTLPIPASERTDIKNAIPTVSHKMIAYLSGLGWIGKNCLLITEKHGPRIRFTSLLTNAPLKAKPKKIDNKCNKCEECIKICPVQAFTGKSFNENESRVERFDFMKCQNYFDEMKKDTNRKPVCGMCLYICPFGNKE